MRNLWVVCGVVMCGCGSGGGYDDVFGALCEWAAKCQGGTAEDIARCKASVTTARAGQPGYYSLDEAMAAGRVRIDDGKSSGCANTIRNGSCTALPLNETCDGLLVGLVSPGGACKNDSECAGGDCANAMGVSLSAGCEGTCRAFTARGQACGGNNTAPCGPEDFCEPMTRLCEARRAAGQPCATTTACLSGLACIGAMQTTPGTCSGLSQQDQPCTSSSRCVAGLWCDTATGGSRTCKPRLGAGDPCTITAACPDGLACIGAADGSARCAEFLAPGSPCVARPMVGVAGCRLGNECDATTSTCRTRYKNVGDACTGSCPTSDDLEANDLYCDLASRTCQKRPLIGEPCTVGSGQPDVCLSPARCDPATMKCALICA
jgi:hypothetical protein